MGNSLFDVRELDMYDKKLLELAQKDMPKETKKFLRKEGTKLRKKTLSIAKSKVDKKTGNYFKGIKKGKVYKYYGNGGMAIRVYGGKPAYHAHLLEYGHKKVGHKPDKKIFGEIKGHLIFERARKEFSSTYEADVKNFISEVVKNI